MKVLHTADWHIGQFKGPVVDGVNLRSQDTVKCLEYMVQVATEEKPDIVCVSGDIFHQEQIGPVRYSDEMINATNIITSLAHFAKYVIVMRGTPNHDGGGQFRVLNRMLLNVKNVSVVTEPVGEHMVNDFISYIETSTVGYKTTMVRCVLRNGFEIIETSACVDAQNYDQKLGEEICVKKIKDKIWYLLGFLLQTAWHGIK